MKGKMIDKKYFVVIKYVRENIKLQKNNHFIT